MQAYMAWYWSWSEQRRIAKWRDVTIRSNEVRQPLLGKDAFHGNDTFRVRERKHDAVFFVGRTPVVIGHLVHNVVVIQVCSWAVQESVTTAARSLVNLDCVGQVDTVCIFGVTGPSQSWTHLQYQTIHNISRISFLPTKTLIPLWRTHPKLCEHLNGLTSHINLEKYLCLHGFYSKMVKQSTKKICSSLRSH